MRYQLARNDKTIIFLHIPKTAGTTLDQIILRHYRFKQIYQTGLIAQEGVTAFKNMSEEARAGYKLLKGHMNFGIHHYIPGPYAYFTFLRDPIDRTISNFYFIYRDNNHPLYNLIHENKMDLEQYLSERLDPMLFNAHTRLLSGVWDTNPAGGCNEFHLEQAKENLKNHIQVIGLTEQFDESLLLLGKAFGWKHLYYKRLNVTKNRPQRQNLSSNFISAVQQANLLDISLYEYAQTLFDAQIQQMGPDFSAEVRRFRFNNRFVQPLAALYWEMRKISVRVFIREQMARFRS
jgi:hypothetical protein